MRGEVAGIKFVRVGCTFLTSGGEKKCKYSTSCNEEEERERERESRPVAKLQFFLEEEKCGQQGREIHRSTMDARLNIHRFLFPFFLFYRINRNGICRGEEEEERGELLGE